MLDFLQVDQLKTEATNLPFSKEDYTRYWDKLSLEWNYNSNHIEGNTLTYGDTMLLLLKDQAPQGGSYSMRELDEMRAHDVAIELIRQWAEDKKRPISESDIRQLNKTILVRPFWKEAITTEGNKTRKQITPGEYKKTPNHVQLSNGKIFKYAEPEDVPSKMQELMDWYNSDTNLHPIAKAALFSYKFVLIHPFDDGNGRISRLLMNYHLLRSGYAPIIIKSSDKKKYLFALSQADTGDLDAFVQYIANLAIDAMQLLIKAKSGESIEDLDDWKKELALLKLEKDKELTKRTTSLVIDRIFHSIIPLFEHLDTVLSPQFSDLFESKSLILTYGKIPIAGKDKAQIEAIVKDIHGEGSQKALRDISVTNIPDIRFEDLNRYIDSNEYNAEIGIAWNKYKKEKLNPFEIQYKLDFLFDDWHYLYQINNTKIKKSYNDDLTASEIEVITNYIGKKMLQQIKENLS